MAGLFDFLGGGSGGGLFGGSYGQDDDPYQAQRLQLAFNGDPASIRFNNPGAQYPGPSALAFGTTGTETIGGGHKIAVFPDPESGAAAQFDLLNRGYSGMTLGDAIRKWSGGNSSPQYISSVSKATGISPSTVLTPEILQSPEFAVPLAKAMARQEAGRDFPMSDEQWQAALARANGGSPIASGSPPGLPSQASELPGGAGTSIPAMAQPTAGQMPSSGLPTGNAPPPTGLPQLPAMNPLLAGFLGFANSRSPMGALGNLVGGLATGRRTDEVGYNREQEQAAQLATYQALKAAGLPEQQAVAGALNQDVFKTIAPNIYSKPQWGVVGHDIASNPVYGWINPQNQSVTLPGGGAAGGVGALGVPKDAQGNPLQGQELLSHLDKTDPTAASMVKAIIRGDASVTGRNLQKYLPIATLVDPSLQQFNYDTRKKTGMDFAPGGKSANNVKSLETVGGHIDKMMSLFDRLGNTWSDTYNSIGNWVNARLGKGQLNAFETAANGVANELGTVFRSAGMSDAEVKSWRDRISSSNSPAAFNDAMSTLLDMLKTRRDVLQEQYKNGMGKDLNPATFQKLDKAIGQIEGRLQNKFGNEQQTVQPEAPNKSIPKVGEVRKGYKFLGGNPADQKSWEKVQ